MKPLDHRKQQQQEEMAMENKENAGVRVTRADATAMAAAFEAPAKKPKKRKALTELPTGSNASAANASQPPPPSKPRTRSVAREESKEAKKKAAEEAKMKKVVDAVACMDEVASLLPSPTAGPAAEDTMYAGDIYHYLRTLEVEAKRRPRVDYIEAVQKDVSANMRGVLVDWLVEVAEEYKLLPDTLYLAVSYVDRFLSVNAISRQKLQLLGVSSMLIAAKYEEINPPHVEDFCYITDNSYTKQEVVKMESDILKFLDFEMGSPTIRTFLRRFITASRRYNIPNLLLEFTCSYLAELSLLDYHCIQFLPSVVAAACLFLAKFTVNPKAHPWNVTVQRNTGYKVSELKDCILALHVLQLNKKWQNLKSIREKYKQFKFKRVSTLAPTPEIPASFLKDFKK